MSHAEDPTSSVPTPGAVFTMTLERLVANRDTSTIQSIIDDLTVKIKARTSECQRERVSDGEDQELQSLRAQKHQAETAQEVLWKQRG